MSKDFFKKKYKKTNSRFHSKAKFKLPLLKKIQTTEKDFGRDRIPSGLYSRMYIGLILLKTFSTHSLPEFRVQSFASTFFMQEQIDHNTIRKRHESMYLALCFFAVFFGKERL